MIYMSDSNPAPVDPQTIPTQPEEAPEQMQEVPVPIEEAPADLTPETAPDTTLPPDAPPPVYMKKPPLPLVAVSLGVIVIFIIGLIFVIVSSSRKNRETADSNTPAVSETPAPSAGAKTPTLAPSPTGTDARWIPHNPRSRLYVMNIPVPSYKNVRIDETNASIPICGIGRAEDAVQVYSKDDRMEKELTVAVATGPATRNTPDAWVEKRCPLLLETGVDKGIIDEDGVTGLFFTSRSAPDAKPYSFAILKKGDHLTFVYAEAKTEPIMRELFDPMFLSFKLTDTDE
jgi:hypothetical protein